MPAPPVPHSRRRASAWPLVAGVAAALALSALAVQRRTRDAERAFPPRGRFVDVDGVRLHVVEHGARDAAHTLVLLHDCGSLADEMELSGLPEKAAERYRVLVFDRPGHGHSERPAGPRWGPGEQAALVAAALAQLGAVRPVVLGHGWGALVALELGLCHPATVGALVLVSGSYYPTARLDLAWLSLLALPGIGALLRHTVAPLAARALWMPGVRRRFAPALPTPAFVGRFPVWLSLRPSQLHASAVDSAALIPALRGLRRRYGSLGVPAVIVAGAEDRHVDTRWHSCRVHDALERSWLRVIEGAGHMVHHVAPGQVLAAVDQAAAMGVATTYAPLATERSGEDAHVAGREWPAEGSAATPGHV